MKKLFWICLFSAVLTGNVFSHPPSAVDLTYDKGTKTLHIAVKHVTNDISEHRIRSITVYRNDEEAKSLKYVMQKPSELEDDVVVEANPGDILKVKVLSTEGGSKEAVLTVPEDTSETSDVTP